MKRSLRSWLWKVPLDQEVDEEIAFHIEMRTRELIRRGMDPKGAREAAMGRVGDLARLRRTCVDVGRKRDREMRVTQLLQEFTTDARFALRQLRASPGFTLVAVLTLSLGIGANSAMFALADATFLRPLPFKTPADRLVIVWERRSNGFTSMASPLEFREWSERNSTFDVVGSIATGRGAMQGRDGLPEQVGTQIVSSEFFDVLGVRPIGGRTFLPSDSPDVVVLSERCWRRRFGADPSIVGRQIVVDAQATTVVGVMPADFQINPPFSAGGAAAADPMDLWKLAGEVRGLAARSHFVHVVGRLKQGVTIAAAQSEMAGIAAQAAREMPDGPSEHGITIEPLRRGLFGPELRLTSMLLLGVVAFVLLMCCANVASLLMSRTSSRARELAVRSALGAGQRRIALQLLTESLVLASIGAFTGAAVSAAILKVAPAVTPAGLLPAAVSLSFDARVLAFCGGAALVMGLLFGLAPAWQSPRASLVQALVSDGRSTSRARPLRALLVLGEIATAVIVLTGAGLLLRAWIALASVDPGHRAPDALTMIVNLPMTAPGPKNRYGSQDGLRQFYDAGQRELERTPGIRSVAWGSALPLDGMWTMQPFTVAGDTEALEPLRFASYHMISETYFETMNIRVVRGRGFTTQDGRDTAPVCIVSQAFVQRYLGNRQPIGLRLVVPTLSFDGGPAPVREIVGVVQQVRGRPEEVGPTPQIYVPIAQNAWYQASLIVRPAGGSAAALVPAVRTTLARVDSERPVSRIRTLDDVARQATSRPRFRAMLVLLFALLALALAAVGVFGAIAYSVQQRTREFGVRLALGATSSSIATLVLSSAGRLIGAGVIVGLAGAAALSRSISTLPIRNRAARPAHLRCRSRDSSRDRGGRGGRPGMARDAR